MIFGHYEVERLLGRGSTGTVYLARDTRIGRLVALKTWSTVEDTTAGQDHRRRVQREAEVSAALAHPNIVTLYEAGYEGQHVAFLAMEYVDGVTLLERMKSPMDVATALRIIDDVLRGLAYAHERGIIHRDIKPANVLITKDGMAKIADFGMARPQNSSLTAAGSILGTPNYMSPEQILGQPLSEKVDVFSTGVMLVEMLTGVRPFVAADLTATLHNILRKEVPHASDVNANVPRHIGDVITKMVAKDPKERPTALEAADALRRPAEIVPAQTTARSRRPIVVFASAIAVLIVVAMIIAVSATQRAERATVQIAPTKIAEFDEKRRELDRADMAFRNGRYQESFDLYNAYLTKYPNSTAAVDGRERAREALQQQTSPAVKRAAKHRHHSRDDEDISPSEMLRRVKKFFKP